MAKFVVKEGPASGQEIPFPGEHFTIGRSEECEVIIADPNVSRQHAQVIARDGSAMLVDLNSSNGTFVNGNPISKVFLMDGDEIRVGETVLIYVET
ncbi:MAG: FHA domain-containing protein, partial [Candidatus Hydrogenedentota bacterium]